MSVEASYVARGRFRRFDLANLADSISEISTLAHLHGVLHPACPGIYRIQEEHLHNSASSTFVCALDCECDAPDVDLRTHSQKAVCSVTGDTVCTAQPIAVLCSLASGGTCTDLNSHNAGAGQPICDFRTFAREEGLWHQCGMEVMLKQHIKHLLLEAAHAIEHGMFCTDRDGILQPAICVVLDGVYSKRCYGGCGKMDALCGAGTVFGAETGMIVACACLSRYDVQSRKGKFVPCNCDGEECIKTDIHYQPDPDHFEGKAGAMEPEAISRALNYITALGTAVVPCKCCLEQGVIQSVRDCEEHDPDLTPWSKILVNEFVGDGDSTVAAKVATAYKECPVIHSRCKNHIVKNQGTRMYKLVLAYPDFGKKECGCAALTSRFIRNLTTTTMTFISHHAQRFQSDSDKQHARNLRKDINNLIYHKTGTHTHCDARYCAYRRAQTGGDGFENAASSAPPEPLVLPDNYLPEMCAIMKLTADKASELVKYKTTNVAENGNQGIQLMTKGKGKNLVQSGSWKARVLFSQLRQIFGAAWVLVLFRSRFPALSHTDYPGLHYIATMKASQDRDCVAARSESRKRRRFDNRLSLSASSCKQNGHGYTGMGGSRVVRPLPVTSAELCDRVQFALQTNALPDDKRVQLMLGKQASSRDWWRLKTKVITSSVVHDVITAGFARRANLAERLRTRVMQGANGGASKGTAPTLARGLAEEAESLRLLMTVMPHLAPGHAGSPAAFTCHEVGIVQHPSDVCSASSPDAICHAPGQKCWFCEREAHTLHESPMSGIARGGECKELTCVEVKLHAGELTQHQSIHELLQHHRIGTAPKSDSVAFSTSASWNFQPHILPDTWDSVGHVIVCDRGRARYALFDVHSTNAEITCTVRDPVELYEGRRCCAALKKPRMEPSLSAQGTMLAVSTYMHQCLWHLYCTGAPSCVFAARSNTQMMVEILYWDEWCSYVTQHMLPSVRGFVTEVMMPHDIVSQAGTSDWQDWIREPIVQLMDTSGYKSWKTTLKECAQRAAMVTRSENGAAEHDQLQQNLQCMTFTVDEMTAVLDAAMQCAKDWTCALNAKIDNIAQHVSRGEHLMQQWGSALDLINKAIGFVPPTLTAGNRSTADVEGLTHFKQKYKSLQECSSVLKPELLKNGWGGRGGKRLPSSWAAWCVAAAELHAILAGSSSQQDSAVAAGVSGTEEGRSMVAATDAS